MTKADAVAQFKDGVLPLIPSNDKPAKRQAWNDFVDYLHRDGHITDKQAFSWDQPGCVK